MDNVHQLMGYSALVSLGACDCWLVVVQACFRKFVDKLCLDGGLCGCHRWFGFEKEVPLQKYGLPILGHHVFVWCPKTAKPIETNYPVEMDESL